METISFCFIVWYFPVGFCLWRLGFVGGFLSVCLLLDLSSMLVYGFWVGRVWKSNVIGFYKNNFYKAPSQTELSNLLSLAGLILFYAHFHRDLVSSSVVDTSWVQIQIYVFFTVDISVVRQRKYEKELLQWVGWGEMSRCEDVWWLGVKIRCEDKVWRWGWWAGVKMTCDD